jgi:multiple sugar transport system substrate-binding protein
VYSCCGVGSHGEFGFCGHRVDLRLVRAHFLCVCAALDINSHMYDYQCQAASSGSLYAFFYVEGDMHSMKKTIRSWRFSLAAVAMGSVVALAVSGCSDSRADSPDAVANTGTCDLSSYEKSTADWKQFSGEEITVAAVSHPWWDTVEPQLDCFTELTGIKVIPNALGEDQYVTKVAVELSSGSSTPDVFMINQFGQATGSGWLEPLDSYLDNPDVTDKAWYDPDDFLPGATAFVKEDGKYVALPLTAEVEMLLLRTDLVPTPPTTMEELQSVAAEVTTDDVAGFSARAAASPAQAPWGYGGFAFSEGAQLLDESGMPAFYTPENIAALTLYAGLIKDYGPAGASGWGYMENQQAMQQGKLAMWADSSNVLGSLMDPATSTVADSVGAFPFPAGAAGSVPNVWYWTIGMNSKSEQKDAAWLFLQWSTSADISTAASANGASPARVSAWDAPESAARIGRENADRIRVALETVDSTEFANTWKETVWNNMSDPLARAINAAVTGSDPAAELKNAQEIAEGMIE